MKRIEAFITDYLFAPISAQGFSIMRIAWGVLELFTYLTHWFSFRLLYSTEGVMGPTNCASGMMCSITTFLFAEPIIHITFAVLCTALVFVIIGVQPRLCIFISLFLIVCFHMRNPLVMNGGDRVEKAVGYLLLIAPNMHWYSLQKVKTLYNSIWVQRLLLWQLTILYVTAGVHKIEVGGWLNGKKLALSLHLEQFLRFPIDTFNWMQPWYTPMSFYTVFVQIAWIFMLVPHSIRKQFIWHAWPFTLKQTIILGTTSMHLGIMVIMSIEMFPIIMIISYIGLLNESDFADIRRAKNSIIRTTKKLLQ